jgi:hypothetical protein
LILSETIFSEIIFSEIIFSETSLHNLCCIMLQCYDGPQQASSSHHPILRIHNAISFLFAFILLLFSHGFMLGNELVTLDFLINVLASETPWSSNEHISDLFC